MKMRKLLAGLLAAALACLLLAGCSGSASGTGAGSGSESGTAAAADSGSGSASDSSSASGSGSASRFEDDFAAAEGAIGNIIGYPPKEINGIIQWGAGGGTDSLMRPLSVLAQDILSTNIVLTNKTGETGSVAVQYVYDQEADGSCLLMGAENPALYDTLGISELTYDNFECIILIGDETTGVVVGKDSPYNSLTEIVNAAKGGKEVTLATTGIGGLPWEVAAMVTGITGAEFKQVEYSSDASAKEAVLSGECDFTISKVQMGYQEYKSGDYKWLCVLDTKPVSIMSDVPLITAEYPEFESYLPWGPFYGVFVKEGTDANVKAILADAFSKAYRDSSYKTMLGYFYINPLGYTGDEAKDYINKWRTNMVDILTKVDAVQ